MVKNLPTHVVEYINEIIEVEGEYSNHRHDHPTRWGIIESEARSYGYKGDMREFPKNWAFHIYAHKYWFASNVYLIDPVDTWIAKEVLDTTVNTGSHQATLFLQRGLTALNKLDRNDKGIYGPDLKIDGRIGTKTVARIEAVIRHLGAEKARRQIYAGLNCQQGSFYINLAVSKIGKRSFTVGWIEHRVIRQLLGFFKRA